jgi:hypothetical protein
MKQIKSIILFLMLILSPSLYSEGKDLIVLLDTSESLFDYYGALKRVFFSEAISNHLQFGDSFHLVSFQDSPSPEISQNINSNADIEAITRRFNQLLPLGAHTDIVSALDYMVDYTNELSPNVPKTIIIITDARHEPPESSPHQLLGSELEEKVGSQVNYLTGQGYEVRLLLINPPIGNEEDENGILAFTEDNTTGLITSITGKDLPIIEFNPDDETWTNQVLGDPVVYWPKDLVQLHLRDQFPLKIENIADEAISFEIIGLTFNGQEILFEDYKVNIAAQEARSFNLQVEFPTDYPLDESTATMRLLVDGTVRPSPLSADVNVLLKEGTSIWVSDLTIIIIVIAIVLIVLLVLLISRWFSQMSGKQGIQSTAGSSHNIRLSQAELDRTLVSSKDSSVSKGRSPHEVLSTTVSKTSKHADDLPVTKKEQKVFEKAKQKKPGVKPNPKIITGDISTIVNPRIYMEVYDESGRFQTNPYKRNHVELREGVKGRVGPPPADLIITLYKFPRVVADIEFKNGKITFTPRDYNLFPELSGPLEGAMGKEIVLEHPSTRLTIILGYYKSPLEEINELLSKGRPQWQTK